MPKLNAHPQYFQAKFVCTTCNNEFISGSTKGEEVRIDTCSNCHPFYTGKQSFANAEGRVEKFKEKFVKKDAKAAEREKASAAQKAENAKKSKESK
ncbi:50S ribosomal protein L31 [Spiroplasma apis]|uniref:Large ribosomal subunit protein bL31 n=1 Tax=Spiroplasma apis B31 TaxID=1276258 RepID=V5RJR1_SPIAP|nr:50S ribosomal protein L31 [Spiroplasma apis B31]